MLKHTMILIGVAAFGAIAGCAAHPEPIVDTKGVNEERLADDWRECESYAQQVRIESGVARGATVGAVIGAAAGAISGEVGPGAGYGAIYGGGRSGLDADRERQLVFKRCLRGRGYRILN